jgi:hypothetical protein
MEENLSLFKLYFTSCGFEFQGRKDELRNRILVKLTSQESNEEELGQSLTSLTLFYLAPGLSSKAGRMR